MSLLPKLRETFSVFPLVAYSGFLPSAGPSLIDFLDPVKWDFGQHFPLRAR